MERTLKYSSREKGPRTFGENMTSAQSSLAFFLSSLFLSIPVSSLIVFFPNPLLRHAFSVLAGYFLFWLAYGNEAVLVFTISTFVTYNMLRLLPRRVCGITMFIVSFSGLVFWHWKSVSSDVWRQGGVDYGGALMVVVLKYISAAMDYQDGDLSKAEVPASPSNSLPCLPSLLEYLSFTFFPAAVLVGPVFSLRPFLEFIEGHSLWMNFYQLPVSSRRTSDSSSSSTSSSIPPSPLTPPTKATGLPSSTSGTANGKVPSPRTPQPSADVSSLPPFPHRLPAVGRALAQAAVCLAGHLLLRARFSADFLRSPGFFKMGLLSRLLFCCGTVKATTWSFYFVWGATEAAMVASGFGFSGWRAPSGAVVDAFAAARLKKEGLADQLKADWSRACSAKVVALELTASPAQMPVLWNISVSNWLRTYIYDRLAVALGSNGLLTLVLTQAVSALWHGLYPGYYLFFVTAATIQQASRGLYKLEQAMLPDRVNVWRALRISHFLFAQVVLAYAPLGFILLRADETLAVWKSLYYCGTVLPIALIVLFTMIPVKSRKRIKKE